MAYLVKVIYKNKEELVPLWSSAYEEEVEMLYKDNIGIKEVIKVADDPDRTTCGHYHAKLVKTKYRLPREFKENRKVLD